MVSTIAKQGNPNNPLDTVIEITDLNGARFTTGCNQPGGTSTDFTSPCLNDDVSASPHIQDSQLTYKVPGTSGSQTFLVHVLDWGGNARPDMIYGLSVSGVIDPLVFYQTAAHTGTVGQPYLRDRLRLRWNGTKLLIYGRFSAARTRFHRQRKPGK